MLLFFENSVPGPVIASCPSLGMVIEESFVQIWRVTSTVKIPRKSEFLCFVASDHPHSYHGHHNLLVLPEQGSVDRGHNPSLSKVGSIGLSS